MTGASTGVPGLKISPNSSLIASSYATPKWWKEAVVYQVYPASFNSGKSATEADGWGDVRGIVEKVPYLKSLGVDVVWTSPSEYILSILKTYSKRPLAT